MGEAAVAALEERIGHRFRDRALAGTALAHASFANEDGEGESNERLEFLGDAVLDLVVAEALYAAHPDWPEGELTRTRAALVNGASLAAGARALGLGELVRLGRTELRTGGEDKDRILANCLEAVMGALYLDAGLGPVRALALRLFEDSLGRGADRDPKTLFQEWAHAELKATPAYETVLDSGTEEDPGRFEVEVRVDGQGFGRGRGRSKREAEREAARRALERVAGRDG